LSRAAGLSRQLGELNALDRAAVAYARPDAVVHLLTAIPARHAELFERFLAAASGGNLAELEKLLADDVVAYNDGGGRVRAAPQPIAGLAKVLRFLAGLLDRFPLGELRVVEANGHPAALLTLGGQRQLAALGVRDGRIQEIYAVLNPDKLTYAESRLANGSR